MGELVVLEAAASFKDKFPGDKAMQDRAFAAAVKSLSGEQLAAGDDPVAAHFEDAFKSLQGVDLMTSKGDAKGTLAERVAFAQQAKEAEFQQTFMVTAAEAAEVKAIVSKAKSGDNYDFSKLSEEASEKLDGLYTSINAKVGYALPSSFGTKSIPSTSDAAANSYIDKVNMQLSEMSAKLRDARLKAFAQAFA